MIATGPPRPGAPVRRPAGRPERARIRLPRRDGFAALLALGLAFGLPAGCGGDEAGTDTGAARNPIPTRADDDRREVTTTAPPATAARDDAACSRPFVGVIERRSDRGHAARELRDDDVVEAVAFPFGERAFTVYASDRPIDTGLFEEWAQGRFSTDDALTAPPGGTLVTLLVGDASNTEPVEAGFRVDLADGRSAPPIVDAGGGPVAETSGAAGTLEVLEVGRDGLCVRVEYEDRLQHIDGVLHAETWRPEQ